MTIFVPKLCHPICISACQNSLQRQEAVQKEQKERHPPFYLTFLFTVKAFRDFSRGKAFLELDLSNGQMKGIESK